MSRFVCRVCGAEFEVSAPALARYPGWEPKYCRAHTPAKAAGPSSAARGRRSRREEFLTRAQVLEKYSDGPRSGIFTDGSAVPNPGPGGWGVVWVEGSKIQAERHGHEPETTNNRMELTALIEAYRLLPEDAQVVVHTDSKLCVDTINLWVANWERRGWKRKGPPIKNLDLIKELWALFQVHPECPLEWIRAHSGYRWNEYADSLATAWLRDEL